MNTVEKSRYGMYSLLSRVFISELSLEDVERVRSIVWVLPPGVREKVVEETSRYDTEDLYLRLRVDYTKTLILYTHPYESVFLDPTGLLCTDVSIEVKRFYARAGYEPSLSEARIRCFDHIGLELGFMAHLVREGDYELQYMFMKRHLARWAPVLGIVVSEVAATGFYQAFGELLARFILDDYRYLKSVVRDEASPSPRSR